jgi:hypothetical protein
VGDVGDVGIGRDDPSSSEDEHAAGSNVRSKQAARHIVKIHVDLRIPRIAPPW